MSKVQTFICCVERAVFLGSKTRLSSGTGDYKEQAVSIGAMPARARKRWAWVRPWTRAITKSVVRLCAGVRKLATRLLVGKSRRRVRGPNAQTGSDRPAYVMPPLGPGDVYDAETAVRVCFQREALEGTAPTTTVKQLVSSGKVAASRSALNQRLTRFRNQAAQLGWNKALANVAPFGRSGRPSLNPRSKANAESQGSVVYTAVAGLKLAIEWACLVERCDKTVEIRTYDIPQKFLSAADEKFLHIIAVSPRFSGGQTCVPCRVTFTASHQVTAKQLRGMHNAHRIGCTQLEALIAQAHAAKKQLYAWQIGRVIVHSDCERAELARAIPIRPSVVWVTLPPAP